MASLAFRKRFRNTCWSWPALPRIEGSDSPSSTLTPIPDSSNWCSTRRELSRMTLARSTSSNCRGEVREKFNKRVDDLAGAEGLLGDLVEQRRLLLVALHLLGQHLRVSRDDRQRRVHLVRHAGRQQSDRAELVGLHQAALQFVAEVTSSKMISRPMRCSSRDTSGRDGDVEQRLGGSSAAGVRRAAASPERPCRSRTGRRRDLAGAHGELVEVMDAALLPHSLESPRQLLGEQRRQRSARGPSPAGCRSAAPSACSSSPRGRPGRRPGCRR